MTTIAGNLAFSCALFAGDVEVYWDAEAKTYHAFGPDGPILTYHASSANEGMRTVIKLLNVWSKEDRLNKAVSRAFDVV